MSAPPSSLPRSAPTHTRTCLPSPRLGRPHGPRHLQEVDDGPGPDALPPELRGLGTLEAIAAGRTVFPRRTAAAWDLLANYRAPLPSIRRVRVPFSRAHARSL